MSSNMRGLGSASKRVCAVVIASLCLVVIPGCSMFNPPPPEWSIQVLDGQFSLAFCESSVSDEIIASVEDSTGEYDEPFWVAQGEIEMHAGEILDAGADSNGIDWQEYNSSRLTQDSIVRVSQSLDGEQLAEATFDLSTDHLEASWIDSHGRVLSRGCH